MRRRKEEVSGAEEEASHAEDEEEEGSDRGEEDFIWFGGGEGDLILAIR